MARKKQKGKLIPFDQNKRVIRVAGHGKERRLVVPAVLFGFLGVLFVLYCLAIMLFFGFGTRFYLIWMVMGLGCFGISFLCLKPELRRKIPGFLIKTFWVLFAVGMALLIFVEALVISRCSAEGVKNADAVIVLGAQWKTTGPSKVLKYRLDRAVEYALDNPHAKIIVSGGQGGNEPIPEADGMREYLIAAGVEPDRILAENTSRNTYENLKNSAELIDKENDRVVIITNSFHVFRAEKLAAGQGYRDAHGLAAESYWPMQPNNLFREFIGVLKDFLLGNLTYWER